MFQVVLTSIGIVYVSRLIGKIIRLATETARSNERIKSRCNRIVGRWNTKRRRYLRRSYLYCLGILTQVGLNPNQSQANRRRLAHKMANGVGPRPQTWNERLAYSLVAMQGREVAIREHKARFDSDSASIGIDNRCSGCISHVAEDFEGQLHECGRSIRGFGGTTIGGVKMGTLVWKWEDNEGKIHQFRIKNSYYVPHGGVRLLSPQHWAQTQKGLGAQETMDHRQATLQWNHGKHILHVPLGENDNVATFSLAPGFERFEAFCAEVGFDYEDRQLIYAEPAELVSDDEDEQSVTSAREENTHEWQDRSEPTTVFFDGEESTQSNERPPTVIVDEEDRMPDNAAAELLRLHHNFGHVSFRKLQRMAHKGILPKRLKACKIPACSACMFAKATRRQWRTKTSKNNDEDFEEIKPGDVVSVDQMVSPTPGLIAQMIGFLTKKRYKYATVYVDQASRLTFTYLQKTATADETLEGKKAFEAFAATRGVNKIKAYHADNGIFKANAWIENCKEASQPMTFAGVNAHHQNGIAERKIRDLQESARAMLLHARKRWPTVITTNLWPYAVRMAATVSNATPSFQDEQRRTPNQIFAKTNVETNPKHWKPFGCPVYVLDDALQKQGGIYHKWKGRARMGIYLGQSPLHNRTVALVLNRATGYVSPQFHVKFDTGFQTIEKGDKDIEWQVKTGFVEKKTNNHQVEVPKWKQDSEGAESSNKRKHQPEGADDREPDTGKANPEASELQKPAEAEVGGDDDNRANEREEEHPTLQIRKRSKRETQPIQRLIEAMAVEMSEGREHRLPGEIFCLQTETEASIDLMEPLLAYKATSDPDTLYLHEAMREPDRDKFLDAMMEEAKSQMDNGNFSFKKRGDVPKNCTILPAVWALKRKRDIKTRLVKKYKARLNVDGSRMKKGQHYDQTYAPVASWNSIRLLLTMVAVHGWSTKQLDYVQAFPQAPVEKELYMEIPKGMEPEHGNAKDYVLQLHKNVYGQKQAGRVWNKYLIERLKRVGFEQSKVDECIFYKGEIVYILYTDDSIIAGPDTEEIDRVIKEMSATGLELTIEGDLQDFLGVNIDRKEDGTIHFTQPHLIDSILEDLGLDKENVKGKNTPASSSKLLSRHTESEPFDKSFDYRSVVGKLNYLEKATRSDIAYITHQCARFTSDPKKQHGDALRWLGRYLKETRNMGTIFKPQRDKDLEVYVDADFSGNWDAIEAATDRDTARSRHGYIIRYAGCPLLWKSQLQTEVALSSTESEYTGLSYALREAIPVMEILKEMKIRKFPVVTEKPTIRCRVFEDNSGALEMANVHKFRPRTKHLNVKLHHFRDYVTRNEVTIEAIDTTEQLADYLTKPVNEDILKKLRRLVMGW
jgi:hypothetical protein